MTNDVRLFQLTDGVKLLWYPHPHPWTHYRFLASILHPMTTVVTPSAILAREYLQYFNQTAAVSNPHDKFIPPAVLIHRSLMITHELSHMNKAGFNWICHFFFSIWFNFSQMTGTIPNISYHTCSYFHVEVTIKMSILKCMTCRDL